LLLAVQDLHAGVPGFQDCLNSKYQVVGTFFQKKRWTGVLREPPRPRHVLGNNSPQALSFPQQDGFVVHMQHTYLHYGYDTDSDIVNTSPLLYNTLHCLRQYRPSCLRRRLREYVWAETRHLWALCEKRVLTEVVLKLLSAL